MNKLLLVIDPQYDFISGTLAVPGAKEAMDALASFIREHDGDYVKKVITSDWHPYDHCSFTDYGGPWPRHCVQDTNGAAPYFDITTALYETVGEVVALYKGDHSDREEYSIFQSQSSGRILEGIIEDGMDLVEVCGIAGDVCVLNTLKDALTKYKPELFKVLQEFCPSLDGGRALSEFVSQNLNT